MHTQAKVMSDRSVLYKYIAKNILFVATVAPKGAGEIGSVTPDESWLVVYLIDTVTGRILHRVTHQGSQGPVRAVSCLQLFSMTLVLVFAKFSSSYIPFFFSFLLVGFQ